MGIDDTATHVLEIRQSLFRRLRQVAAHFVAQVAPVRSERRIRKVAEHLREVCCGIDGESLSRYRQFAHFVDKGLQTWHDSLALVSTYRSQHRLQFIRSEEHTS